MSARRFSRTILFGHKKAAITKRVLFACVSDARVTGANKREKTKQVFSLKVPFLGLPRFHQQNFVFENRYVPQIYAELVSRLIMLALNWFLLNHYDDATSCSMIGFLSLCLLRPSGPTLSPVPL